WLSGTTKQPFQWRGQLFLFRLSNHVVQREILDLKGVNAAIVYGRMSDDELLRIDQVRDLDLSQRWVTTAGLETNRSANRSTQPQAGVYDQGRSCCPITTEGSMAT